MFQISGLGAIDLDRNPTPSGGGGPDLPGQGNNPWGYPTGGGGGQWVPGPRFPPVRGSFSAGGHALTPMMPSSCPKGFRWGLDRQSGKQGCYPVDEAPPTPVAVDNPQPGTTVTVGAEQGTIAYDEMQPPIWQRPIFWIGVAAVAGAVGVGYLIARRK